MVGFFLCSFSQGLLSLSLALAWVTLSHKHVEITGGCVLNEEQSSCVPLRFLYSANLC